jgi:Pyridoxamine 5'-phosphate oxidase
MTSTPSALVLTQQIKDLVNGALDSGNPILLAAVDAQNRPVLSFRGSTQVHSDDSLGLWVRNVAGGTIEAIKQNPQVALMYRSATVPFVKFEGRAHIATDPAERNRVFEAAPEREQKGDPDRKGLAVVIELDKVSGVVGFGADGPVFVGLVR